MTVASRDTPCRGVVFDFDGVLVDSEPLYVRATAAYLDAIGRAVPPEFFDTLYGRRTVDIVRDLAVLVRLPYDTVLADRQATVEALALAELAPLPGVADVVSRVRAAGVRCAIASSSNARFVSLLLAKFGLSDAFEAVVGGDQVTCGKPHPEPYLRAVELLGVAARDAVAVEDSPVGIASARAAGLRVVQVTNAGAVSRCEDADAVFADLLGVAEHLGI